MKNNKWNTHDLISILREAAQQELLPRFAKVNEQKKADNSIVTEADIAMQRSVKAKLQQLDESILFLAEEMSAQEQRNILQSPAQATWILDPLDGTTNFSAGIPYYAVSLALIEQGEIVLGIVFDPERNEIFYAEKGQGAKYLAADQLHNLSGNYNTSSLADAVACIDLKRLPVELATKIVTKHPFRSQRSFGGVALDWCWLAAGRFDIYLHGKQNIWDYAAGYLIFNETGGHSCTLQGEAIFINDLLARSGVAAGNSQLFDEWTNWLGISLIH